MVITTTTVADLLTYAYNEADLLDSDRIQRALDGDPNLQEEYDSILQVMSLLDAGKPEIAAGSIEKILQFC